MKNRIIRILAVSLALLMLLAPVTLFASDEGVLLSELKGNEEDYLSPIPLLVILVSYDANGNGMDDYDAGTPDKLYGDKTSEYYGEQWISSPESYWSSAIFGEKNDSMLNFFKKSTNGKFYFTPATETYKNTLNGGRENDGIVQVTVPYKHPMAKTGNQSNEDTESRVAALKAANEFVDFASYDKDGNGKLTYDELGLAFITAGYEYSATSSRPNSKIAFGVHAHYTNGTGAILDGVAVGNSGFIRVGEYLSSSACASIGVIAHELTHFIGAPDLYDGGTGGWAYAGNMSLMSSGSWNRSSGGLSGTSPSFIDPFNLIYTGILSCTSVSEDGEYTLYSHTSSEGDYNILKISTPDPNEYYLIENRYHHSSYTSFDAISQSDQCGVVIWHIDDSILSSAGMSGINSSGKDHDPGIAVIGIKSLSASYCAFQYKESSLDGTSYTFIPGSAKYKFPISKTSYTSLTKELAEKFNMKLTVLSKAGNEMTVKIENCAKLAPSVRVSSTDKTETSITFKGRITDLNGGNVTSCGFIISKNANPTEENGTLVNCTPDEYGSFEYNFEGLEANTKYFCKLFVTGKNGTSEMITKGYTLAPKVERTDYYLVFFYKNLTDTERSYEVKVKPGANVSYSFPMKKNGYTFCGWYLDPEFTERFDMSFTQTKCDDFPLYAKWVKNGLTTKLVLSGAESKYMYFETETGDVLSEPVPKEREGFIFNGWYADEECTVKYDFSRSTTEEDGGSVTVYASWSEEIKEPETTTTEKVTTTETTETPVTETTCTESETTTQKAGQEKESKLPLALIIGAAAVIIIICALVLIKKKKK